LTNPVASRLITCRNATLAQLVLALNQLITGIGAPVIDATQLPSGLIPIARALQLQLGLQLQPGAVPESVLVVDHVETRPLK